MAELFYSLPCLVTLFGLRKHLGQFYCGLRSFHCRGRLQLAVTSSHPRFAWPHFLSVSWPVRAVQLGPIAATICAAGAGNPANARVTSRSHD